MSKRGEPIRKVGPSIWLLDIRICKAGQKEIRKRERFEGSKDEARERYLQRKRELRDGVRIDGSLKARSLLKFKDLLRFYIEKGDRKTNEPFSVHHLKRIEWIEREIGEFDLREFPERFEAWFSAYKTTASKITKRTPGNAAQNRIIEVVKAAYNRGIEEKLCSENPITRKKYPKLKERPRDRYLSIEERNRLLAVAKEHSPYIVPILQYALLVPCRISDLVNLPQSNYNRFNNTLYFGDSKNGDPMYKPIPAEMQGYFKSIPADCPWVFYRQDETGYHQLKVFRRTFKTCCRLANITNFRFHDTRHISATDLYAAGNPERQIMDIAGWRTPMLSTYRHKNSLVSALNIRWATNGNSGNNGHSMDSNFVEVK